MKAESKRTERRSPHSFLRSWSVSLAIIALALVMFSYKLYKLVRHTPKGEHAAVSPSAAFLMLLVSFVVIVMLALAPKSRSAVGLILKYLTILLLVPLLVLDADKAGTYIFFFLSLPAIGPIILFEGRESDIPALAQLGSIPLIYAVGGLIGYIIDDWRRKRVGFEPTAHGYRGRLFSLAVILPSVAVIALLLWWRNHADGTRLLDGFALFAVAISFALMVKTTSSLGSALKGMGVLAFLLSSMGVALYLSDTKYLLTLLPGALGGLLGYAIDAWLDRSSLQTIPFQRPKWRLLFLMLVLAVGGVIYALIRKYNVYDSALLYIGIPLVLALGFSVTPRSESAVGASLKGTTLALLLSAPIFQEGYICILFAAPLFYLVALIIGYSIDELREDKGRKSKLRSVLAANVLALLSLEGVTEATSMPRDNEVVVSKVVPASIENVRSQLARPPRFGENKPIFLRIFPYPVHVKGEGLQVGDKRVAKFVAYKHIWWTKVEGNLVMEIAHADANKIKFIPTKDESYLSHYLKWKSSEVLLEAVDASHTKVTWKIAYKRILDPAWYFGPLQRYAVWLTSKELIDHAATPSR